MPPYAVSCSCGSPAAFKIAAAWSDGLTRELKTYALCCRCCLDGHLRRARAKQAACRLAPGESLDVPAVLDRTAGLLRRPDLEQLPPESPSS